MNSFSRRPLLKTAALAAVLTTVSVTSMAQSVHDASQASALTAAGASAAIAFVPLSVSIGGSALVGMTLAHFSRLVAEETSWIVDQVQGKGPRTELTLRSATKTSKPPTVMIVGVPTTQVVTNHVTVNNNVRFERLGGEGFALKQGNATLGVMVEPGSGAVQSTKK